MVEEYSYHEIKQALLDHIREIFDEIEEELARSHDEKYVLLEDMLENANDISELKVAFEQWFMDHAVDLDWEYEIEDIWNNVLDRLEQN